MKPVRLQNVELCQATGCEVRDICFTEKFADEADNPLLDLDLTGFVAWPGLINSHDHLPGNWYKKIATPPYANTYDWLSTYRELPAHDEKARVWVLGVETQDYQRNMRAMQMLAVYKNLFSGVTTVFDHLPRQQPDYYKETGIRVVEDYWQTHSPRLQNVWGGLPMEEELRRAGSTTPFVLHLAEGVDEDARTELARFRETGGLRRNLVIIHGVGLTQADIDAVAEVGASIVWCPDSNVYLLDAVMDLPYALQQGVNIAIGTDTTVTGSLNLFDELRSARSCYKRFFATEMANQELLEEVTRRGARLLFMENEIGTVARNCHADLLLSRKRGDNVLNQLFDMRPRDVALVIRGGKPLYGDLEFADFFKATGVEHRRLIVDGQEKLVWGDPLRYLALINGLIGRNEEWPMLFLDSEHYAEVAGLPEFKQQTT